ncbi:WD40-repeat-containing domain protein [Mycena latifolia]|nr:WD40-repeat-containing domain protein [Mycena latifolia]
MPSKDGFKFLLASVELLKECSDWFGPLKAAAGGLHAILLILAKHSENSETMQQLGQRIEMIAQIADMYRDKRDININNSLQTLAGFIEKTKADLEAQSKRPKVARLILSNHIAETLGSASNTLNDIIRDLNLQTLLVLRQNTDRFISEGAMSRLRCPDAFYNSVTVSRRGPCAIGTRESVLDRLNQWARSDNEAGALMLLGRAGYGKTSIAYSFCQKLERQKLLGASFFCSRAAESTTRVSNILPSVCYNLGTLDPLIIAIIQRILFEDPDIGLKSSAEQFSKLLLPVATRLVQEKFSPIIVIDGLDECADDKEVSALVRLFCDAKLQIKLLLTCRPEQRIRQLIRSLRIPTIDLHDSGTPIVSRDISIFVRQQLVDIAEGRSDFDEPHPWPSNSDVSRLADLAHGMFLVASAACDYIGGRGGNIPKRLREVVTAGLTSTRVQERLDHIYRDILHSTFSLLADDERLVARKVLGAIANLFDSLSIGTLDQLLNVPEGVRSYLSSFHSILRVGSGNDPLVGIGHHAFREFFSDSSRSYEYCLDPHTCHEEILIRCLHLLSGLQQSTSSTTLIEDLPQISATIRYACRHWASHLSFIESPADSTLILLGAFVRDHLLHWLACLSRLEELVHADRILQDAEQWAQTHRMEMLASFVDARRFTSANFARWSSSFVTSLPDALRWSPTDSLLRRSHDVPPPAVLSGLPRSWGLCETSVFTSSVVMSMASLPDGEMVACGSYDGIIQIRDPRTLQVSQTLQGHDDCVRSLEFSCDGSLLVSSSDDETSRVWDVDLGICQVLFADTDAALCAVFTSDSTAVVTGSAGNTIRWWDRATGTSEKIFHGHDGSVNAIRLTSDDRLLVSASQDSTLRVWNTITRNVMILPGHSRPVTSLLLLDDAEAISSSDDGSVRLWNIISGNLIKIVLQISSPIDCFAILPKNVQLAVGSNNQVHILDLACRENDKLFDGHGGHINALSYLPHGHHILSASDDRTLRTWDLRLPFTEDYAERHSDTVNSFSFSHDGHLLVSASDDGTARVWDTNTGQCTGIYEQTHQVSSAKFSWDGAIVVTETYNHSIRGWELATGNQVVALQGNSSPQWSVAASADGLHAASGSQAGQIQIYDAASGHTRHSLSAHQDGINCLAFSRDGQYLVSGSYDFSLKIWSTMDGSLKHELRGHVDWVRDTTFTSTGQDVVSGSSDKSVRIWNLADGRQDILWGHSGGVNAVDVSHDDTLILSAGEDKYIFVWSFLEKSVLRKLASPDSENAINSVRFSPDSTYVAAVSSGMSIALWATGDWGAVMLEGISSPSHFWSVAFSPDGRYIATGSEDGVVRLWSLETRTITHELKVEESVLFPIWKIGFSGSNIVAASEDAVVRVWNVEGRDYTTLPGSSLPDGSRLHDGGIKQPIRVEPPDLAIQQAASVYSLSDDGGFIMKEGAVCSEIPSTYRDYRISTWHGSRLALGYGSGLVVLIKCD